MRCGSGRGPQAGDEAVGADGRAWRVDAVANPSHPIKETCTRLADNVLVASCDAGVGSVRDFKPLFLTKLETPKTCGERRF